MPKPKDGAPVRKGDILDGKYRVEKVLGEGGMGVVVAARHVKLETRVALKFLQPALAGDRESVKRFEREARAAVALKSEHAVKVLDVGELPNGAPYLVMEFLVGADLGTLIDKRILAVTDAVAYVLQACEAVAEAHALGIVHRDLKPANLFLTESVGGAPLVKVVDFGLAKMLYLTERGAALTMPAEVMGSPAYMSPEQVRAARDVDVRTDIWSLGVCLYELLQRQMPFRGPTMTALCLLVANEPPAAMTRPDVPADLVAAVYRCLEKDPAARFQDVAAFAAAIEPHAGEAVRGAAARIEATLRRGDARSLGAASQPPASGPLASQDVGVDTRTAVIVDSERRREARRRWALAGITFVACIAVGVTAFSLLARTSREPATGTTSQEPVPERIATPWEPATATGSSIEAVPLPPASAVERARPDAAPPPTRPRPSPPSSPSRPRAPRPTDTSRAYP